MIILFLTGTSAVFVFCFYNKVKIRDNLKLDEKKISQSLQVKEEQRNTKQKNIKNLSNKYKQLQKEKDSNLAMKNNLLNIKNDKSNLNTNTNSIKTRESEEKKIELENNLRQMKEEELNNDRNFKNFVNNVDNNLNNFETKALSILGQKRQKSVEIKKEDYEESLENKNNSNNFKKENFNINGKQVIILFIYFFIDIKSGFKYNIDDTDDINIGLKNNLNVKKRNINTNDFV